ncbi:hypothetical protein ACF0H5_007237 [Mactra antiquata]
MGNFIDKINTCRRRLKNLDNTFGDREPKVLILGLDGAGKTAILYKSKLDDTIFANPPPRGINIEMMTPKRGARIKVFDMPGHKMTRHLWHTWFMGSEAVVFVVDSVDNVRVDEAKFELHDLLQSKYLRRVPLIVLANKQDLKEPMNTDVMSAELDLSSINDRDWSIYATSAVNGTGIKSAFKDTVDKIIAFRHYKAGLVTKDELIRQSDIQKDIEVKSDDKVDSDQTNVENVPSLFAALSKQTDIENDNEDGEITKDNAVLNDKDSGSGPSSVGSNPAEYDRPSNLGDVNVDVSSNESDSLKAVANVDSHNKVTDERKMNNGDSPASKGEAASLNGSDTKSDGGNSVTEQAIVHSSDNSDINTNGDRESIISDVDDKDDDGGDDDNNSIGDSSVQMEIPNRSEKVTDLDAYSNDSELDLTEEDDPMKSYSNQIYEFEPNDRIAVV